MRYSVRADAAKKAVELDIYDDIGQGGFFFEAVSAKYVRRFLTQNSAASEIKLRINSKGGDVLEGFAIYNLLAQHPGKVVAEVDGLAASMASVVLMAADEIHMASNARIMIHNPSGSTHGSSQDMRQLADLLDSLRDDIADAYVARTGVARDKVLQMMANETWLTAAEAKKHGFVDTITPAKTRPAAQITACLTASDLDDFSNVPESVRSAVLGTSDHNFAPVGIDATVTEDVADDVLIEVEEVNEPVQTPAQPDIAALISAAVSAALAPVVAQVSALQTQVTASASDAVTASAATFAASVSAECERAISAGKLPNSPESRAHFAAHAKDPASLSALSAFYAGAPQIVATSPFTPPATQEAAGPQLSAEQMKLCNAMGWDPKVLFAKE